MGPGYGHFYRVSGDWNPEEEARRPGSRGSGKNWLATVIQDDIMVGRIRQDESLPENRGINMWVAGDQLRKGAALNAIQIAEVIAK